MFPLYIACESRRKRSCNIQSTHAKQHLNAGKLAVLMLTEIATFYHSITKGWNKKIKNRWIKELWECLYKFMGFWRSHEVAKLRGLDPDLDMARGSHWGSFSESVLNMTKSRSRPKLFPHSDLHLLCFP